MNDVENIEAVRAIARILVSAYFRIRFPEAPQQTVDCPKTKSESCDERLTV